MENTNENEELIRSYLLGKLAADERERIEQRLMVDREFFDRVSQVESDLVDLYVRDRMSGEDRESFENIFFATPEGRRQVAFARALAKYVSSESAHVPVEAPPAWRPSQFGSYLKLAASFIVIAAIAGTVWQLGFREPDVSKAVVELKQTYSKQRPLEARLTIFDYAPYARQRSGPEQIDSARRDQVMRKLQDTAANEQGARARHVLGQALLADRQFDEAITQLEAALSREPENARILSDLGAAWLERGRSRASGDDRNASRDDYAKSLEHLNRALEVDNSLLDALFNRAILYDLMMEPVLAEQDFRKYLDLDPGSPWADEARERLR